ncbi:hypothetical protein PMZ80_007324 [Knufia obscura]|uniref:Uncharacterized protein n=2 Tax=Knufia TaxID=430999 RepID=A0AAN8F8L6_9EURO|nr:hypothetical protein PMZ80_007324 [Knufia obscura]KAK5953336.1 hypothetical protein OHC33_005904 [Knufia fluminis]
MRPLTPTIIDVETKTVVDASEEEEIEGGRQESLIVANEADATKNIADVEDEDESGNGDVPRNFQRGVPKALVICFPVEITDEKEGET